MDFWCWKRPLCQLSHTTALVMSLFTVKRSCNHCRHFVLKFDHLIETKFQSDDDNQSGKFSRNRNVKCQIPRLKIDAENSVRTCTSRNQQGRLDS